MSSLKVIVHIVADMRKNRNAAQIVFAPKNKENNEDQSFEAGECIKDTSEASIAKALHQFTRREHLSKFHWSVLQCC